MKLFVGSVGNKKQESEFLNRIQTHCSGEIIIKFLRGQDLEFRDWVSKTWSTPYESLKYAIPELCKYELSALYLDCSCEVLSDLNDIFDINDGKPVVPALAFREEVMIFNNEFFQDFQFPKISEMISSGNRSNHYLSMLVSKNAVKYGSNYQWNCVKEDRDSSTKIIRNGIPLNFAR